MQLSKTLLTSCKFDILMLPLLVEFAIIAGHCSIYADEYEGGCGVVAGVALGGGDSVPIQIRSVVSRGSRSEMHGDMDVPASTQDLESRLTNLSATVKQHGEEILGTLMFSSQQRGPLTQDSTRYSYGQLPYMRGAFMADAKRLDEAFKYVTTGGKTKHVPCLGFYSYPVGEVGIASMVGEDVIIQTDEEAMQNPIVVFALFVVPRRDVWTTIPRGVDFDDSRRNVEEFFAENHIE